MAERPAPELAEWPVSKLKGYSRRHPYFGPGSEDELLFLSEQMCRDGVEAIDVTPEGVVISGRRRLYIADGILGMTTVPVRIHHPAVLDGGSAAETQLSAAPHTVSDPMTEPQEMRGFEHDEETETQPVDRAEMTHRWRELHRIVRELSCCEPVCLAALTPEQRGQFELAYQFIQRARGHVADLEQRAAGNVKPKLVAKNEKVDELPKLKLKPTSSLLENRESPVA